MSALLNRSSLAAVRRGSLVVRSHATRSKRIVAYVAERYNVPMALVMGMSHEAPFVAPRHVAMYLCQQVLKMSLPAIGQAFEGRHHTTAFYAVHKIAADRKKQPELERFIQEAIEFLKA